MFLKNKLKWWYPLAAVVLIAALLLAPTPEAVQTDATQAPVLIIDAGHGGADGGAVAADGTLESGINLDIALRLEALASFWGVKTVMTRTDEDIDYPENATTLSAMKKVDQNTRIALINQTPNAVLFSIHQNYYPASSPWGIQVFYGSVGDSGTLATVLQSNLTEQLCKTNRRIAEPIDDNIYLMRMAKCRAVLIECGFLSNAGELQKLKTDEYRLELAAVMLASYLQYIRGQST